MVARVAAGWAHALAVRGPWSVFRHVKWFLILEIAGPQALFHSAWSLQPVAFEMPANSTELAAFEQLEPVEVSL
jgi:hypothetical protein